jgi:hypothetical protein
MQSKKMLWLSFSLLNAAVATATISAADYIWVEGESATLHTMKPQAWYDSVTRDSLSGGQWLSHFGGGTPPEAEFQFEAPQASEYYFWIRANSVAGPRLSYQLAGGDWVEVDLSHAIENLNIAADGKPDMRFISWIDAGKVRLSQGRQTIRFKFHSANQNHGGLDCFVFSQKPFRPRGALKPGEKSGKANPGYFAWEPDVDDFDPSALVDLAGLNEDLAGQNGYVRAVGSDFVLGGGQKVKFWAANVGPGLSALDHASHVYLAKNLAKRGVNLVRLHGGIYGQRNPAVDLKRLDDLQHMVWALRQEGIYVKLSFYFPLWFYLDGDQRPFMLLYFDDQMQEIYFRWADKLLTTDNPYTGLPLGKDPGVAIVEVVNEDSHFFWTFGKKNMAEPRWREFTGLYGQWLAKRYGSLDRALAAWGGVREPGDDPDAGRMELYSAWEMTTDGIRANERKRKRIGDQVRFLTENMRGFYARAADFFRNQCGCGGLVSASNWQTADARTLDALERYCYTAGDVIDHHGYFDHNHEGQNASWSVRPGQKFQSQSALYLRDANPLPYVETDGYPHITSEIGWPMPNAYRAEAAFLTAAYGSLWGLDGIIHFAVGSPGWDQSVSKFPLSDPAALGSYFAAALVYRREYVREAPAVVTDNLRLEDLYEMKGTAVYTGAALDQLRAAQIPPGQRKQGAIQGIDPLTFYAGRVVRSFQGKPEESTLASMTPYIDRNAKTISSVTGELLWDYGAGLATINAPKAQGAAGFLGKHGPVDLDATAIDMKNDYGTVIVVAMDDRPLADSEKILVQCMTIDQLYGWETSAPDGFSGTIQSVGSAPWGVQRFDVSVTLKLNGAAPTAVTACDENGYATKKPVRTEGPAARFMVKIDGETAYTVIER